MSAKQKKKRNKPYRGAQARVSAPVVTRVSAEEVGPLKEWWRTYGRVARFVAVIVGVLVLLGLLIVGIVGILTS